MDSHVDTKVDSHTVKNLQELLVRLEALQVDGKGLDDKSNSMEILMSEDFAKIKPTDPLILARHASRRNRKWPNSSVCR
jgi:hypothetical protein